MFQHVTECNTHFLLRKRRQKLKRRQEYTGKACSHLRGSKCHMTISEGKEKSQSGMQLYRKCNEHACSPFMPLVQMSMEMTDLLGL